MPEAVIHPGDAGMETASYRRAWGAPFDVLNLGSGSDYRPGWTNMDLYAEADVKHDMTQTPWPFEDESFDGVYAHHVLEHVPSLVGVEDGLGVVLREIQRVLRPGGRCSIGVPYPGSTCDLANPTHYRRFCLDSFHFLQPESRSTVRMIYDVPALKLAHRSVVRVWKSRIFDNAWHGRKYLGRRLNVGRPEGLLFVLRKEDA